MKNSSPIVLWFRQDLRIHDNPAFYHAVKAKQPIIFVYIVDDNEHPWKMGEASKWWLHYSLESLNKSLKNKYDAQLTIIKGDPLKILLKLHTQTNFTHIYWNRCYEPYHIARDKSIKLALEKQDIVTCRFNGALLKEPWEILNQSKQFFKVFTPFWRALQKQIIREVYPAPKKIQYYRLSNFSNIDSLNLLPSIPWDANFNSSWQPGEENAQKKLRTFLNKKLKNYKVLRDFPGTNATSTLSPHLHYGEISPVQIWHAVQAFQANNATLDSDANHFLSEIAWREFSYYLLYHFPQLPDTAFKHAYDKFPWKQNARYLQCWQKGITGYPIVDAGMRELWATGWMHNRVRMIAASFLIKHLLQPWQQGEAWFWDTLVDADLANNAASWQWVAGSGADAAPYFRIFNPVLQGKKFDPEGKYITTWIPELNKLPLKYIHAPWEAPLEVLQQANIVLGEHYPSPIVNHTIARTNALQAYGKIVKKEIK